MWRIEQIQMRQCAASLTQPKLLLLTIVYTVFMLCSSAVLLYSCCVPLQCHCIHVVFPCSVTVFVLCSLVVSLYSCCVPL